MAIGNQGTSRELDEALGLLVNQIREGLSHGFFEYSVRCEIAKGGKRQLTIGAGKSHRFLIGEEEIGN